jgi:hypothetical protein
VLQTDIDPMVGGATGRAVRTAADTIPLYFQGCMRSRQSVQIFERRSLRLPLWQSVGVIAVCGTSDGPRAANTPSGRDDAPASKLLAA